MPGFIRDETPMGLRLERMLQRARGILAVPEGASKEQIRAAFVKMARYHHPDTTAMAMESEKLAAEEGYSRPKTCYTLQAMCEAKDLLIKQFQDGE